MAVHIIIDGYNYIHQSDIGTDGLSDGYKNYQDLQGLRDTLISTLAAYKKHKAHKITIVFDAQYAPTTHESRSQQIKGIKIKFSRPGETADEVIKRMAAHEKERALIVSSDREIVDYAQSKGAVTVSSPEFEQRLMMELYFSQKGIDAQSRDTGWKPTTKKKGPSHRLSKKERKKKQKLNKL